MTKKIYPQITLRLRTTALFIIARWMNEFLLPKHSSAPKQASWKFPKQVMESSQIYKNFFIENVKDKVIYNVA